MLVINTTDLNATNLSSLIGMSQPTRVVLIIINILIVLLGVCGNVSILYLSKKYDALEMDKISVIFLENLAVADILMALMEFLPMLITLIADRWVLGKVLCSFIAYFKTLPTIAKIFLITAVTCHRLHILIKPLRAETLRSRTGHIPALVIWGICFLGGEAMIQYDAKLFPEAFTCTIQFDNETGLLYGLLVLVSILMLVIVLGNIWLLYSVAKSQGNVGQRPAVITTMLISGCFVLSWLPTIVLFVLEVQYWWFFILQRFTTALNVLINPFIYYLSKEYFRSRVGNRLGAVRELAVY